MQASYGNHSAIDFAPNVTRQFKRGTVHFEFDPADTSGEVVIRLDIWARTSRSGVGYSCPITLSSAANPSISDTVVAKMITCLRNCVRVDWMTASGGRWGARTPDLRLVRATLFQLS